MKEMKEYLCSISIEHEQLSDMTENNDSPARKKRKGKQKNLFEKEN